MKNRISTTLSYLLLIASCGDPTGAMEIAERSVWVLVNDLPGADKEIGKDLLIQIAENEDYDARVCSPDELSDFLTVGEIHAGDTLVLTDCGILPVETAGPLDAFAEGGGRLVCLGGTLFREPVISGKGLDTQSDDRWFTRESFHKELSQIPLDRVLFDFSEPSLEGWSRGANDSNHPSTFELERDPERGQALHGHVLELNGWDHLSTPLRGRILEGQTLVCFWAKGGERTDQLAVEFEESDGSRWIATVDLKPEWRRYVLNQSEFRFWESIPERSETSFQLTNAVRFSVGLATTHTKGLRGDHEFWIDEVGTRGPHELAEREWGVEFRNRDPLYPAYHVYSCSDVTGIENRWAGLRQTAPELGIPSEVSAFHPRPQSTGWNKSRENRWIPLLEAFSAQGEDRGVVAAMRFTAGTEKLWVGFAPEDPGWYRLETTLSYVAALIGRIHDGGPFLWEGGTTQYTYFPDQSIEFGAQMVNGGETLGSHHLRFEILDPYSDTVLFRRESKKGDTHLETEKLPAGFLRKHSAYQIAVSLIESSSTEEGARIVDQLVHSLDVWEPNPDLEWVSAAKGYFTIGGSPWYPYGVNYMPSSGVAREEWRQFEYWLDSDAYDPEIVERDLSRIEGMGLNSISAFLYHRSLNSWNLIDLLRRCERRRLRVNLSIRPGTPMDFPWEQVKETIQKNRLAENRTVFAYDLAWEPHFEGKEPRQEEHGEEWNRWIESKYGSLETAAENWGHAPEIVEGSAQVPGSRQWYEPGPWNEMLADYSHFLDELLGNRYGEARKKVRTIDNRHLVSFRMQHSGDPTYWGPTWIPYPLEGLVDAVDILEPEAYGRIGGWDRVKPGMFTAAYCRAIAPDLPVYWAEMGLSCWDPQKGAVTAEKESVVADYYRDFLRMARESYANGISFWWYPGGYRTNENSDYGILNPDGTDRPVTRVIRENASLIENLGQRPKPDVILPMDRSWKPGGLAGSYDEVASEYWEAVEEGKQVALWDVRSPTETFPRLEEPFLRFKSSRAIVRDGSHNAFTDIAYWRDRYYVAYRKGTTHMTMDGIVEIRASEDGENWTVTATFDTGNDDRDVKLLSTPDRLIAQWSSAKDENRAYHSSFLGYTEDGANWIGPQLSIQNGRSWRAKRSEEWYYCAVNTPYRRSDQVWSVDLYRSREGLEWEMVSTIATGDSVNETSIHPEPDGSILAIVRRKFPNDRPLLYRAEPPSMEWKQEGEIPIVYQGPGIWEVEGRRVAIGRYYPEQNDPRTGVFELVGKELLWMMDLPSGGDNSYAGLVRKDESTLWVSYYSDHGYRDNLWKKGQPSDVYLAEIEIVK